MADDSDEIAPKTVADAALGDLADLASLAGGLFDDEDEQPAEELAGDGPAWLQTAASAAEQLENASDVPESDLDLESPLGGEPTEIDQLNVEIETDVEFETDPTKSVDDLFEVLE